MQGKRKISKYIALIFIMVVFASSVLCACSSGAASDPMADVTSYSDLNDPKYTIGVATGTINDVIVEEVLPKARIAYLNTDADMIAALESGKVDALAEDVMAWLYYNAQSGDKLRILDGYLKPFELGFVFRKDEKGRHLREQMNEFIEKSEADGTLKEVDETWLGENASYKMAVDYTSLPADNGVIRMATTLTGPPFSYMIEDKGAGYDVDIISRFCKEYGYGLEVMSMSFDGLLPSTSSGKCDIAGNALTITEERAKSVDFSIPYYKGGTAAVVLNAGNGSGTGLAGRLKDSFTKTFIVEQRYRLFASGILTTLLITLLSALFGTILGFLVFMLCRNGNRVANAITKISVRIIEMLPVVVVLMILYYIAFAKTPVDGIFVSVVAFTLTFASSVFGNLTSSVSAIDRGQTEAAYALGFGNLHAFFKVVLPQALIYFIPSYKSELVSLIKATAVVGYIAVQDLTRMGDIVRGRTYEAFFPLIAVAVIYFVLAWLMILLADRLELRIDPKRRKREDILKGIKTND